MFFQKVDMRSKEDMISFLKEHFRYNTMNSWNRSTSYANNMKIYKLGLTKKQESIAWDIICDEERDMADPYYTISELIDEFNQLHDYDFQVGSNGRSSGYLVLYKGGYKVKKYFEQTDDGDFYSPIYRERFSKEKAENHPSFEKTFFSPFAYPGKEIDMHEDFKDWPMDQLRERVKLVQQFDRLCDRIVDVFRDHCDVGVWDENDTQE